MKLLEINARFLTKEGATARDLNLPEQQTYTMKPVQINIHNINYIEEYDGVCLISFIGDDSMVTDVPIADVRRFEKVELQTLLKN